MYYAANNSYSTETSIGFANTWYVLVFDTREDRDNYVARSKKLAARAITKKEISRYTEDKPKPFTGNAYCIRRDHELDGITEAIGTIEVGNPYQEFTLTRLYK